MTTAQEILRLIEGVDPSDTDAMDELSKRVYCWLNNLTFEKHFYQPYGRTYWFKNSFGAEQARKKAEYAMGYYTRSRDALKSIRPDGWMFFLEAEQCTRTCEFSLDEWLSFAWKLDENNKPIKGAKVTNPSGKCKTEELAELHAIVQAIAYERNK